MKQNLILVLFFSMILSFQPVKAADPLGLTGGLNGFLDSQVGFLPYLQERTKILHSMLKNFSTQNLAYAAYAASHCSPKNPSYCVLAASLMSLQSAVQDVDASYKLFYSSAALELQIQAAINARKINKAYFLGQLKISMASNLAQILKIKQDRTKLNARINAIDARLHKTITASERNILNTEMKSLKIMISFLGSAYDRHDFILMLHNQSMARLSK